MRIVFMGTPDFAVPTLEALVHAAHEVVCVYTQPPRKAGRGKKLQPTPVHQAAERLGIEVRHPASLKSQEEKDAFAALHADVGVVAAYGLILPQAVLDAPTHGCLNVHGSLLPAYRGASPIQRAILDGQAATGVTIMQMDAGLDTGAILSKAATPIGPTDNAQTLHDRLAKLGAKLLLEIIPRHVAGEITPEPQDDALATHAAKITRDMGRIDWSQPATQLWNRARAFTPWPGVFTRLDGKLLKLLEVEPADADCLEPGRVGQADAAGIIVGCGNGALRITQLQKEGAKRLAAAEFLAGAPLPAGTQLG